jgi:hypothetical protein
MRRLAGSSLAGCSLARSSLARSSLARSSLARSSLVGSSLGAILLAGFLLAGQQLAAQSTACIGFARFTSPGSLPVIQTPVASLHEVSGLEASRINPGVLWAHDDANNSNHVVAVSTTGRLIQSYQLGGAINGDWEDIAIGPGPQPGRDYIYLADIGNNDLKFSVFSLIRFAEPVTPSQGTATPIVINSYETFAFRYPSQVHDAETLLIDPVDGVPYILTKEKKSSGSGYLYSYPLPFEAQNIKTLKLVKQFSHVDPRFSGGDTSADGRWVVVRNDSTVYTYLRGAAASPFADAFTSVFCTFDASNQGNAESLALATDAAGTRLYCTSEGAASPIYESIGTLPSGTVALPAWWSFGSGVGSAVWGQPLISLDEVPAVGRAVGLRVLGAMPSTIAGIGVGTTAIPDHVIRFGQGWAHVSPAIVFIRITSAAGDAAVVLGTVPNQVSLLGAQLHGQTVIDDRAAPFGMALSRGLTLQVGR